MYSQAFSFSGGGAHVRYRLLPFSIPLVASVCDDRGVVGVKRGYDE